MAMTQSLSRRPPPSTFSSIHGPRHRCVLRVAASLQVGPDDVAELARNKVLIAATVASTIGQLSKPFTSAGKDWTGVDNIIKTAARSGGMPSTHSAAVIAVTTSLGLERGFADSIFGMSVVFAAIVMYDAQGVRREVGNQARVLNKLLTLGKETAENPEDRGGSTNATPELPASTKMAAELQAVPEKVVSSQSSVNQLNESVGHTGLQVTVGAMLGFVVSLAVHAIL